ncbi:MAG: hypothetical protein QG579_453, partial [Patescibacteria group bacterium]|nr:hypothetical protein [Patescibacteria group bacterium]
HAVKKSRYQYEANLVGVVSTDPGFVSGAYTENSYPIGLIGRVPVKVSTENGMIRVGDYLTTSSVPGHAMKATLSGRVLGKALESIDPAKLTDCPASDVYVAGRKCTTIMMFVNLIDYGGQSVDLAMSDWTELKAERAKALALETGLEPELSESSENTINSIVENGSIGVGSRNEQILGFLAELKAEREKGVVSQSELFTDRLTAVSQIISPEFISNAIQTKALVSNTITTNEIRSNDGLKMTLNNGKLVIHGVKRKIFSEEVASSTLVANIISSIVSTSTEATTTDSILATSTEAVASTTETMVSEVVPEVVDLENDIVISFDTNGDAYFAGEIVASKISAGGLSVTGTAVFTGGLEVDSIGNASTTLSMLGDVTFFGRPYFTSDTGGTATVKKGAKSVDVVFDREYVEAPIISTSIAFATTTNEEEIEAMFNENIQFVITKRDTKGFTVRLNKQTNRDIVFNWIALAIKDSKEFTSRSEDILPITTTEEANTATTTPEVAPVLENVIISGESTTTPTTAIETATTTGNAIIVDELMESDTVVVQESVVVEVPEQEGATSEVIPVEPPQIEPVIETSNP